MAKINPQRISGNWTEGFVLDVHTLSSTFLGYDEFGHERFDTKRSELGELLFRLKSRADESALDDILQTVVEYLTKSWQIVASLDLIIPMPPSNISRLSQPVMKLARGVSSRTGVPISQDALVKIKETPQLKNVYDYHERTELLKDAFRAERSLVQGKSLLLLDDLYRSGATMNEASRVLRETGNAKMVYVLALTKTRSIR
ncbi:MAG: ComF family protein [Chloroflexi bacterium]|nr:ComF family protein [Chloroflexota bacterium]